MDLQKLRDQWDNVLNEYKLVAEHFDEIFSSFPEKRKKKRSAKLTDLEGESFEADLSVESDFRVNTFYKIIGSVLGGITARFEAK